MRYIAGALVVLAGALLWGSSVCAVSMIYMGGNGGNTGMADTASSGGMVIVVVGCVILALAHVRPAPKD
jgi:hypothetical protein